MRQKRKINVKSHKPRLIITSFEDICNEIYYHFIQTKPDYLKNFSKIVNLENIRLIQTSYGLRSFR